MTRETVVHDANSLDSTEKELLRQILSVDPENAFYRICFQKSSDKTGVEEWLVNSHSNKYAQIVVRQQDSNHHLPFGFQFTY